MMLGTWKLAPCLAAGCTAVLKPWELAPLSLLKLGEIAQEADLPPGVLNILPGFAEVGAALTTHPGVDALSFTGGVATGKRVLAAAASTLKRISRELGGKSPNIVFADADLDQAVPGAVRAIFRSQGQSCVAGSRLLLQDAIYEPFMERFFSIVQSLKVGDPLDPKTDFGPLITAQHRERVEAFIRWGLEEGARLAWDIACSAFGGRQVLYERFFFGDPVRLSSALYHIYDKQPLMERVRQFLKREA